MRNWWFIFMMELIWGLTPLAKASQVTIRVQTYRVENTSLSSELKYPGTVTPRAQGKLTSEISGIVTQVKKRLGEKVAAHEAVFYVRQNQAGVEFKDYAVRSPIAGVLSSLDTSVGQFVQSGLSLGDVIDPKQMKVTVEAPAQDVSKIQLGLRAEFIFDSTQVELKVTGIAPTANPTTGTSVVELEPHSSSHLLRSGLVGKTTLFLPPQKSLAVPARAIITMGADTYVRLIDQKSHVHFAKVSIGPLVRDMQVILDGLKPQDEVIVKASAHIKEGDTVVRSDEMDRPTS